MKTLTAVLILVAAGWLFASAERKHVNYRVPGNAIEYAELVDCDYQKPPNCRAVNLVYKSGTEVMVIPPEAGKP